MTDPRERAVVAPSGPLYPPDRLGYWKSSRVRERSIGAIETLISQFAAGPSPYSVVAHEHLGGAMGRVSAEETAFGHRDAPHGLIVTGKWADSAESARNVGCVRACWDVMRAIMRKGVYVNYEVADGSTASGGPMVPASSGWWRLRGGKEASVWKALHAKLLNWLIHRAIVNWSRVYADNLS